MAITQIKTKSGKKTTYRASAYVDGRKIYKRGFRTKREAQKWIDETRVNGVKLVKPPTFGEVAENYMDQYRDTVRPSTFNKTRVIINHAVDALGDLRIDKIKAAQVQQLVNDWSYQYVHFKKMAQYTSCVFKYAMINDIIDVNPCDKVKWPKPHVSTTKTQLWTEDEAQIFLSACKEDERIIAYPMFRLLLFTGVRRGELVGLKWSDLDGDKLHIQRAVTFDENNQTIIGPTKNKTSNRVIALDAGTLETLQEWHNYNYDSEYIFPVGINTPNRMLKQIANKAGLPPATLHKLRHIHCTVLIDAGANIKDVQKRLGHSDVETTLNIYAHAHQNDANLANLFSQKID